MARTEWLRVWARGLLLLWVAGLCACAAVPGGERLGADPRTESDQSPQQRRALLRLELAQAYLQRGQALVALDEVKQALALSPELPAAWSVRGWVYLQLGDLTRAQESFDQAHRLAPDDPDVLHNRAWLACLQGRSEPAFAQAQEALSRVLARPGYDRADRSWLAMALCQERAGQLGAALKSLSRPEIERASEAQTLWQAARLARRLDNAGLLSRFGTQLQSRFAQSPQAKAFREGTWDE